MIVRVSQEASGGLDIWVSSNCLQKSNIDWPQQPPTEKFNQFFFSKHHNKTEFKTLKSSIVIFQALESLQPQWPQQPQPPQWPQWPRQPHFIKILLIMMVGSYKTPKWPIMVPSCGLDQQNSNFLLTLFCWRLFRPSDITWRNSNFQTCIWFNSFLFNAWQFGLKHLVWFSLLKLIFSFNSFTF